VADAGLDYTQRTNKIAHHVVLEQNELPPAGPAALLMHPGFMETAWSGEPRTLAPRAVPQIQAPPRKCELWEQITGDAGWGGYLAEPTDAQSDKPIIIVYDSGVPMLELLAEAMAMQPSERRWETAFSTYHTKLPPGFECHWRCVFKASSDAGLTERIQGAVVIRLGQLAQHTQSAPDGRLVHAARTGELRDAVVSASVRSVRPSAIQLTDRELEEELQFANESEARLRESPRVAATNCDTDLTLHVPLPIPPTLSGNSAFREQNAQLLLRARRGENRKRNRWAWIAGLVGLVFVTATTAGVLLVIGGGNLKFITIANEAGRTERNSKEAIASNSDKSTPKPSAVSEGLTHKAVNSDISKLVKQFTLIAIQRTSDVRSRFTARAKGNVLSALTSIRAAVLAQKQSQVHTTPRALKSIFAVGQRTEFVELPEDGAITKPHEPISVRYDGFRPGDLAQMSLSGFAHERNAQKGLWYTLAKGDKERRIISNNNSGLGTTKEIGILRETKTELTFVWTVSGRDFSHRDFLRNCGLNIKRKDLALAIFLRKPLADAPSLFRDPQQQGAGVQTGMERLNVVKALKYVPTIGESDVTLKLTPTPDEQTTIEMPGKKRSELLLCFRDSIVIRYAAMIEPLDQPHQLKVTSTFLGVDLEEDIAKSWTASGALPTPQQIGKRVVYPIDYSSVDVRLNGIDGGGLAEIAMIDDRLKQLAQSGKKTKDEQTETRQLEARKSELRAEAKYLRELKMNWQRISKFRVDWIVLAKLGNHQVPLAWSVGDGGAGN
jgi:hypothetical protein